MLKVIKNNEQWVYGLNEEQEETLKEYLTFNNPAYNKALRFSGYSYTNIPPYLTYYEKVKNEKKFKCPLGVNISEVLETDDISFFERRKQVDVKYPKFLLELRADQEKAEKEYLDTIKKEYPQNIIQLPTGKGKSILALHIASILKQKTLILVHKDDLVVGWKKDIELCFGKNIKCGLIKAKKREVGEQITIATVQTLGRMSEEELKSYVNQFGFVVQDEVHHLGLNIFNIINKFNSKYKLGLSATPKRNDGLNFVFDIFLGGICYKHIIRENDEDINNVEVEFIKSPFKYRPFLLDKTIYNYYTCDDDIIPKNPCFLDEMEYDKRPRISYLSVDDLAVRNSRTKIRVCKKIIEEYKKGLSLIVLFTQKEHLEIYKKYLIKLNVPENQILMFYGDSTLSSEEIMRKAENKESLITLATYAKATEGTNVKAWEVEFLVSSINNQKNVEQVTGRIRRRKEGKINPVKVYDIVYSDCYSLSRHEDTRLFTYKKLGYKILNANSKKLSGKFNKNDCEDKVKVNIFSRGYN